MALYADTSALVRMYLLDEAGSADLREMLLEGDARVITSELSRLELARSFRAAERARRIADAKPYLAAADSDFSGPIDLVRLRARSVLRRALELILELRVGTLDSIHLAVALETSEMIDDELVFVTRDREQAEAARALGFAVA